MLFRRIIAHITKENWFAVFLDFIIVVIGVFIGLQVANWNDGQSTKTELYYSLQRLNEEVAQNIGLIDDVLKLYQDGQDDMNQGRDALNACSTSPEGQAALERLLFRLTDDVQPNFVTFALDQIADEGRYQALLSPQFQQDFGSIAGHLKEEQAQLTSHYMNMWSHHVNYHPSVNAFFPGSPGNTGDSSDYEGWSFKLAKPFDEVCTDASFRNRFINSIGFFTSINGRLERLKLKIENFQISLTKELERL